MWDSGLISWLYRLCSIVKLLRTVSSDFTPLLWLHDCPENQRENCLDLPVVHVRRSLVLWSLRKSLRALSSKWEMPRHTAMDERATPKDGVHAYD